MKPMLLAIALLLGGWLLFDGSHALMTGDYVTPHSGPSAGHLGLWSQAVSAAGFAPRGTFIKLVHVALGLGWLGALVAFPFRPLFGRRALLAISLATLWYLPVGTALALAELGLLFLLRRRILK